MMSNSKEQNSRNEIMKESLPNHDGGGCGSCLGVASRGASVVGRAASRQLLRGEDGGFGVASL